MAVGCWPARKLLGSGKYSVRCLPCVLCTRCVHTSLLYMYKEDYTKLGIPENSSIEEIKSAYFKKAKELHPDSRTDNLNEEADFIDLTNAYKRLVYESKFGTDSFNVTDPRNDPRRQEYWDIRKRTKSTKEIKVEEEILQQRREKERTMLRKAFLGLMLGIFFGTIFPALFIGENDYKEVCTCEKCSLQRIRTNPSTSKSYAASDPVKTYCLEHSTKLHPVQLKLQEQTLKLEQGRMLGAPEVISLNAIFIRSMRAKKVLDIGVFTGASSLAAALALPEDGKVLACDINDTWTKMAQEYWVEAGVQHKIELVLAPATETLEKTLDNGEEGSFDFAFIDADKPNYEKYYELCLKLLRTGGMMAFDNTLWSGDVLDESKTDTNTAALRELNKKLSSDPRVTAVLLNVGDGLTLVTKL